MLTLRGVTDLKLEMMRNKIAPMKIEIKGAHAFLYYNLYLTEHEWNDLQKDSQWTDEIFSIPSTHSIVLNDPDIAKASGYWDGVVFHVKKQEAREG